MRGGQVNLHKFSFYGFLCFRYVLVLCLLWKMTEVFGKISCLRFECSRNKKRSMILTAASKVEGAECISRYFVKTNPMSCYMRSGDNILSNNCVPKYNADVTYRQRKVFLLSTHSGIEKDRSRSRHNNKQPKAKFRMEYLSYWPLISCDCSSLLIC